MKSQDYADRNYTDVCMCNCYYKNPIGTPAVREASAALIRIHISGVRAYKRENNNKKKT